MSSSKILSSALRTGFAGVILATAVSVNAQASRSCDEVFQPQVGQSGKDVIWVPTPDELVSRMLAAAKVTKDDLVFDLGAGDGKIAIAAARDFGARSVGIEFKKEMAELARCNAQRAGVGDRVTIINGDIFKEDFSKATVISMYLLPELNLRLRPTILKMKPGTRIVTNSFTMGDWEPDRVLSGPGNTGYYWVVPASVEGNWALEGLDGNTAATLALTQRYQRVGGTIALGGKSQPLLEPRLEGAELRFAFIDGSNGLRSVRVTVDGASLKGESGTNAYLSTPVSGRRAGN
jgi:SAM-dependent methyltransferase